MFEAASRDPKRIVFAEGEDERILRAAQPLEIVRARTPSAPSGDYASYVRKTTCDDQNRFSFKGLPDGAWFVITLARPENGGEAVAVMRRVETHGAVAALNLG